MMRVMPIGPAGKLSFRTPGSGASRRNEAEYCRPAAFY